jgi:hypothetical protein
VKVWKKFKGDNNEFKINGSAFICYDKQSENVTICAGVGGDDLGVKFLILFRSK